MVYHGPSKGCGSCRWRRKKCDQTRPSCMRCIKANRPCGGYELEKSSAFRQYDTQSADQPTSFILMARKCGLPKRVPIPGTAILPEDTIPAEVSEDQSNMLGLRSFMYDYPTISANESLSRSYLCGLEGMACRSGPKSDLTKACQAVSFASHGKPMNRPRFVDKASKFYQELLVSLARTLESPPSKDAKELKVIAMLLGIFQIVMANEVDSGNHITHANGLSALLNIKHLPLNPLITLKSGPTKIPQPSKFSSTFSTPALSGPGESLEDLLFQLYLLWTEFEASILDATTLKSQALLLDRHFAKWEESRTALLKPTILKTLDPSQTVFGTQIEAGAWPGKVDTYFDLYVAGIWNIFRVARLILIHHIIKVSETHVGPGSYLEHIRTANRITEDIAASIPYHLAENLQEFLNEQESSRGRGITEPGRFLGGLLLIHPLYVASRMWFVDERIREYFRGCLMWIGENMGIGQAGLFAKAEDIDRNYIASGWMIIWSGFFI